MKKRTPSILVAMERQLFAAGISKLISRGEVGVIFELSKLIDLFKENGAPDLLILDLVLNLHSDYNLIYNVRSHFGAKPRILVVSDLDENRYAGRVLSAGANGYLMPTASPFELNEVISRILKGETVVSPNLSKKILLSLIGSKSGRGFKEDDLSNREMEVFELIGQGLSTREIAENLMLSVKTIESHRANIKFKMKINFASELVQRAIEHIRFNRSDRAA